MISDDVLRSQIVQVYELSYKHVEAAVESELRVILDLLQPYYLKHFSDLKFHESATPLGYRTLISDTEFLNIIDYRLEIVRQNNIPRTEATIEDLRRLIAAIDQKLGPSIP